MKRKAYITFTASATYVVTGEAPKIDGETARIEVSRKMAASMKRQARQRAKAFVKLTTS